MKEIIDWLLSHGFDNREDCNFTKTKREKTGIVVVNGKQHESFRKAVVCVEYLGDGWISGDSGCEVIHCIDIKIGPEYEMLVQAVSVCVRDLDEFIKEAKAAGIVTPDDL